MGDDSEEAPVPEHPHIARRRNAYLAFGKGDLDALQTIWAPDLRWHTPGNGPLAGTYEGIPPVLGFLGRVLEISQGTFRAEPQAFFAGDDLGVAEVRLTGQREGHSLDVFNTRVSRFVQDRIVEFRDTSYDLDALDRFFA
jgi:hypothetical protein